MMKMKLVAVLLVAIVVFAGVTEAKRYKWKDRKVKSIAKHTIKKCEEWHISDHDESIIIKDVVKAINLGAIRNGRTYLDEYFTILERKEYKGTFSYSNLYGKMFKDKEIFGVEENYQTLLKVRDRYAPAHRHYDGIGGVSFGKTLWADITSGAARDRIFITVKGMGSGAWAGIKGLWEMVTSPIKTAKGMYTMVVEYDKTIAGLDKLVDEYIAAAKNDPDKFAEMTGKLSGQIMVTLVSPAKVIKGQDALNVLRTVGNTLRVQSKLYHYTSAAVVPLIKHSNKLKHGKHAKGVFATTVPPALMFSNSLFGMLVRAASLGGRLDFFFKAGRMIRVGKFKVPVPPTLGMKVKPPFTHAVQFMDKGMKLAVKTSLEAKMGLAVKSLFLQYGKKGNVALGAGTKFIEAASMQRSVMESLLNGLGYVVVPVAMVGNQQQQPRFREMLTLRQKMKLGNGSVRKEYDCSLPKTVCAVDKLPDAQIRQQEAEFGTDPFGSLYKEYKKPSLADTMKALTCCDSASGDCCGLNK